MLKAFVTSTHTPHPKALVAAFTFLHNDGKIVPFPLSGFPSSKDFPAYRYIPSSNEPATIVFQVFTPPRDAKEVIIKLHAWLGTELTLPKPPEIIPLNEEQIENLTENHGDQPGWLPAALRATTALGALSHRIRLLTFSSSLPSSTKGDKNALIHALATRTELTPGWYPQLYLNLRIKRSPTIHTVCHLQKTAYPYENTGGAIRCLNILRAQQSVGLDPFVITPLGYPEEEGSANANIHEYIHNIEHFRVGNCLRGARQLPATQQTTLAAFESALILRKRSADVIHAASGTRGYDLALQALALRDVFRIPVVYEVRSFHEHTWSPMRDDVMQLEMTQLRLAKENFCMICADAVVTLSSSMKSQLEERGIDGSRIHVIPNAIDYEHLTSRQSQLIELPELEGADFVVGYVSNMSEREGHSVLLHATKLLLQEYNANIGCLLVGTGPQETRLRTLAYDLGIQHRVHFAGHIDHAQIHNYYSRIDVFVVPRLRDFASNWVTPLKPLEAMALGRPLIVSDLPALRELVGDQEQRGLLSPPGDHVLLARKIIELNKNRDATLHRADRAREWILNERSWKSNALKYLQLYREVQREWLTRNQ